MDQKEPIEISIQSLAIFEPQSSIETTNSSSNNNTVSGPRQANRAPEKKLTLFALRLAVLEKAATGLGTLGFIWATVVLLGGFAITIDQTDFWFVTVILLIEGTRIFSRSRELEWQHQATWSLTDAGISSFRAVKSSSHILVRGFKALFQEGSNTRESSHLQTLGRRQTRNLERKKTLTRTWTSSDVPLLPYGQWTSRNLERKKTLTRTWTSSDVPLLPYGQWVFLSRNISRLLYWLQLASATACVVLSLIKLVKQNFGEIEKGDTDKRNRKSALIIFYSLALAEALLFLLEKAYWEWKVTCKKLLDRINQECQLGPTGIISVRRFFYDSYSKCVNGSIFDGLKMDFVSFAMELMDSDSSDEQLIGMQILGSFTKNPHFSEDTLQKIGITITVIERLVEMLNWKDPQEEEIRKTAAEILIKLAGKKQNSLRVAGIPGAMESVSSLLHNHRNSSVTKCGEISKKEIIIDKEEYGYWAFNQLGLQILKKLARDQDNCAKIGNTKGLLVKIIDFTHAEERLLKGDRVAESQILIVKTSLQVLKMLASTTGGTGRQLRSEISEVVFTISYIRDILRYGEKHPTLQKLGIEILTSLALDADATERIGGTGGVLKELFNIFFREGIPDNQNHVRIAAGEALGMLAFESTNNCLRVFKLKVKLKVAEKLVNALENPLLRINAARILRNLFIYSGSECFQQLRRVITASSTILKEIMTEENKLQEVMVGLAAHVFRYMTSQEASAMFKRTGIQESDLATALVQILKKNPQPQAKTPRIRRYVVELAIWMMKDTHNNIQTFKNLGMQQELEGITETTAEIESFDTFSGAIGLSRYKTSIHSLVETAVDLLENN
ncbi:ARM repeat superfamily protein [Artemisia annua]|uniref:ARM repeat superfamily protein n=1 Tax=Artemisia annua TaxID=35608 RepID=A0A2U1NEZ7_ARTAN|nr:ARM repeat superfamily protein [Artemisia annua]